MPDEPLPIVSEPEYLTATLRGAGALGEDSHVQEVVVEGSRATILSRIVRLRLVYQGEAAAALRALTLKTGLPERLGGVSGRREVAFYTQVAAAMPGRLVPRCFDAHWDAVAFAA